MALVGKVALVTGAAQGLGLATTHILLKQGAKVGILDYSADQLDSTCRELEGQYGAGKVLKLLCDVTNHDKLVAAFTLTKNRFGSLDIVVNNAGVAELPDWEKVLHINLHAVIQGTVTAIKLMSVNSGGNGGVVINVSSMAGIHPTDTPVYCASKTGVIGYTRSMKEIAELDGVRVNCICPWFADTAMGKIAQDFASEPLRKIMEEKGLVKPSMVAEGILELITDTTRSGAVMRVTPTRGLSYHNFNAAPPTAPRSKL